MSRRRFHAPPEAFTESGGELLVTLASEEARHLRDVLRLGTGDEAFVFDGEGREYLCTVKANGRGGSRQDKTATLAVRERANAPRPESSLYLTLAVALLKGEKFDLVVQKATELGVTRVVPVVTKRADVRLRDTSDGTKRAARWQRLALEAAKQSGRARVPRVATPASLAEVLAGAGGAGKEAARLMFAERAGNALIDETDESVAHPSELVALVGPEGGWEDEEIDQAIKAGWRVVTLGGRTLRAETAAIIVTTLLQHRYGDLV